MTTEPLSSTPHTVARNTQQQEALAELLHVPKLGLSLMYLTNSQSNHIERVLISPFHKEGNRGMEPLGHIARMWQSQDLNPGQGLQGPGSD